MSQDNPHDAITHEGDMAVMTALNDIKNSVPAEAPVPGKFQTSLHTHPSLYSDDSLQTPSSFRKVKTRK
jgi:hypothetical protein